MLAPELSEEHLAVLDLAAIETKEALAALGLLHLEHEALVASLRRVERRLQDAEKEARHAALQSNQVLAAVARAIALPPGAWTYDPKARKLVNEEAVDD